MTAKKKVTAEEMAAHLLEVIEAGQLDELLLTFSEDLGLSQDFFFSFGPQFELALLKNFIISSGLKGIFAENQSADVAAHLLAHFIKSARRQWTLESEVVREEWTMAFEEYETARKQGLPFFCRYALNRMLRVDAELKNPATIEAFSKWMESNGRELQKQLSEFELI
jgi:hypothetical protein